MLIYKTTWGKNGKRVQVIRSIDYDTDEPRYFLRVVDRQGKPLEVLPGTYDRKTTAINRAELYFKTVCEEGVVR